MAAVDDGIDGLLWNIVVDMCQAAQSLDRENYRRAVLRLRDELPDGERAGLYLWGLVGLRILRILEQEPSKKDLARLARQQDSEFGLLVDNSTNVLEATYCEVFHFATPAEEIDGTKLLIYMGAALGLLVGDPESDLHALRPGLLSFLRGQGRSPRGD